MFGKGENAGNQHFLLFPTCLYLSLPSLQPIYLTFVEDNAAMRLIQYFENHALWFLQNWKEVDPIKLNSL